MAHELYRGGCLCGAVRYEVRGAAANPCYCHCRSCRLAGGAPMVAWATFAREHFAIVRGALAEHRSSARVWRGCCAACGSALTYRNEARVAEIDLTLATLDEPQRIAPQMHVWVADKLPWLVIRDDLPQHAAGVSAA
jgi:hypothetical protein